MKVVILAGGYGTRLSEETTVIPKPLVEIGGEPILWHIMKHYAHHGLNEFVICCGYKGHLLKRYFLDYFERKSDLTIDLASGRCEIAKTRTAENWKVTLVDTGLNTLTGGRIKRVADYLGNESFCLTYGDGVSDVDIGELIAFHRREQALATVTAVQLPGRFGALEIALTEPRVSGFREKSHSDGAVINGGFFVLEPGVLDLIDGDDTVFEQEPLQRLVAASQLAVYHHPGYWQNMDTLRDKAVLQEQWDSGSPPWRTWDRPQPAKAAARA